MKWNLKPLNIKNAIANHLYYYLRGFPSSLFFCSKIPPPSNLSRFKIIGSIYYINVTQLPNTRSHYFTLHTLHLAFQFFFSTPIFVPSHARSFLSIAKLHTSNFSPQKSTNGCSVEPVMRFKFSKSKP